MGVASPAGIPGGGSRGGFEGSRRAGPAGESPAGEIWKLRCVGQERGAEKRHVAGETWRAGGRKGAMSQAVGLQGQFWSDCSLLPSTFTKHPQRPKGFPDGSVEKNPPAEARRHRRRGFDPWVRKIPWRRKWQPTLVFLPRDSSGQRNLACYSPWGCKESDMDERLTPSLFTSGQQTLFFNN